MKFSSLSSQLLVWIWKKKKKTPLPHCKTGCHSVLVKLTLNVQFNLASSIAFSSLFILSAYMRPETNKQKTDQYSTDGEILTVNRLVKTKKIHQNQEIFVTPRDPGCVWTLDYFYATLGRPWRTTSEARNPQPHTDLATFPRVTVDSCWPPGLCAWHFLGVIVLKRFRTLAYPTLAPSLHPQRGSSTLVKKCNSFSCLF